MRMLLYAGAIYFGVVGIAEIVNSGGNTSSIVVSLQALPSLGPHVSTTSPGPVDLVLGLGLALGAWYL